MDGAGDISGTLGFGGPSGTNDGSVFELSGSNHQTFTLLTAFNGTDGSNPEGGVTIDANGNIWGTTSTGGLYGSGTVYELSGPTRHTLTTVYNYTNEDGSHLVDSLTPDAYGNLYGEASGYPNSDIFELTNTGFAVPEPTGVSLLAICTAPLLRRRRRSAAAVGVVC